MSPQDQVLYFLSGIGVVMMGVALFLVRRLDRHEREHAALNAKAHPAE